MERFYIQESFRIGSAIELKEEEHHHLANVMRIQPGEEIDLINGLGFCAKGVVLTVEKKRTTIKILSVIAETETPFPVFLGVPFMRPSKLEWVIEKGTEIGARGFYLYEAEFSLQKELSENALMRLRNITISAMKQSQRLFLPHIEIFPSLTPLLHKKEALIFGDLAATMTIFAHAEKAPRLFISGPEKGFSPKELEMLRTKGSGVTLSDHVLRAETAPIVAISVLQFQSSSY